MSEPRTQPKPKLNAVQVGEHLGVPRTWVLEQARKGEIPHHRLGKYVRFELDEIEAWWNDRKVDGHRPARRLHAA